MKKYLSWRYIKWLLVICLPLFAKAFGFLNVIIVNADVNYSTYFNFSVDENFYDINKKYGTYSATFKDIFDTIIDLDSSFYDIFIIMYKSSTYLYSSSQQEFSITLVPKNTHVELNLRGNNSNISHFTTSYSGLSNSKSFYFSSVYNSSSLNDFYQTEIYTKFIDCYLNSNCANSYTQYSGGSYSTSYRLPDISYYLNSGETLNFNDMQSYDFIANNLQKNLQSWYYYTNADFTLKDGSSDTGSTGLFYKKFKFNDIEVSVGDSIPTYYDLFHETFLDYSQISPKTYNFFNYNITPSNSPSFHVEFDTDDNTITSSSNYKLCLYGKKLIDNYYSYDKISCLSSIAYNDSYDSTTHLYHYDITYSVGNISNLVDPTDYESFSFSLYFSKPFNIYNLEYSILPESFFYVPDIYTNSFGYSDDYLMDRITATKFLLSDPESNTNIWACSHANKGGYTEYIPDKKFYSLFGLDANCSENVYRQLYIYDPDLNYPIYFNSYSAEQDYYNLVFRYTSIISLADESQVDLVNYSYIDKNGNISSTNINKLEKLDSGVYSTFFDNFLDSDPQGLSGIVSAPLALIRSIATERSCAPITLDFLGKQVDLASGCSFWNRVDSDSKNLYWLFTCGLVSYRILISLFREIEKLKDPDDDNVSTLDL